MKLITIPTKNIYKASKLFQKLTFWCNFEIEKNNFEAQSQR